MPFLPKDFVVPDVVDAGTFRLRPITIHDAFRDYDAVMSSREHLWARFGEAWGWPSAELTLEQNIVDLGWHQKEFQLRRAFNWAVLTPDEKTLLGCCYLDPSERPGFDAEAYYWVRTDRVATGLEERVGAAFRAWLAGHWPFANVAFPGRDQPGPASR